MKRIAAILILIAGIGYGQTVTVNAVGDMMIGTLYPSAKLPADDGWAALKYAASMLTAGDPDIVTGNLEGAMTESRSTGKDMSTGRSYAFRMPVEYAKYLKEAGFTAVTVANNHAYDFGAKGYEETRKIVRQAGVAAFGESKQVLEIDIRGIRVGMIGFSWHNTFNNILNTQASMKLIREASARFDILIVSVHGGNEGEAAANVKDEMEYYASAERGNMMRFCRLAVENGADLILGHGPHIPRAVELYRDRLIAYSLGNFATYMMFVTANMRKFSPILQVEMERDGRFVRGKILPMIQFESGAYRGIPHYDPQMRAVEYMRRATALDCPMTPIRILENGDIERIEDVLSR